MNHENIDPEYPDLPPLPKRMGLLATADELLSSIRWEGDAKPVQTANSPQEQATLLPESRAPELSRDEYIKQQELEARRTGDNNPYFD